MSRRDPGRDAPVSSARAAAAERARVDALRGEVDAALRATRARGAPALGRSEREALLLAASALLDDMSSHLADTVGAGRDLRGATKTVHVGPRGGAYYVNPSGRRVWLKRYQRDQCAATGVLGTGDRCPPNMREYRRRSSIESSASPRSSPSRPRRRTASPSRRTSDDGDEELDAERPFATRLRR